MDSNSPEYSHDAATASWDAEDFPLGLLIECNTVHQKWSSNRPTRGQFQDQILGQQQLRHARSFLEIKERSTFSLPDIIWRPLNLRGPYPGRTYGCLAYLLQKPGALVSTLVVFLLVNNKDQARGLPMIIPLLGMVK